MTALRRVLLLSLLLSGAAIAGEVSAEQDAMDQRPIGRHMHGEGMHGWHHGPGMPMKRLLRGLDLSDEQKDEIKAIMMDSKDQMQAIWAAAHDTRQAVMDLVRAGDIDENELRRLADALGDSHAEAIVMRAHIHSAIRAVLTPEQLQELDTKIDTLRELGPGRSGYFKDDA